MNGFFNGYPYINNFTPNMMPINYGVNPLFRINPMARSAPSLLSRLTNAGFSSNPGVLSGASGIAGGLKNFSWSTLLNGASKTLGVINQAIPVLHQIRPIWNNTKTMLRVMKAVNSKDQKPSSNIINNDKKISSFDEIKLNKNDINTTSNEGPIFFV